MDNVTISIEYNGKIYFPQISGQVTWTTYKKGAAGCLQFNVINDFKLDFHEGCMVCMSYGDKNVFKGYVFSKQRDKNQIIQVTAYDQLRYFKNKHFYTYYNKSASQIIKELSAQFNIKTGDIQETGVTLSRIEDGVSLFDIIQEALSYTKDISLKDFILYDDFGLLTLKNADDLVSDYYIKADTIENFSYSSSIDNNVFNKIVVGFLNRKSGVRTLYTASDDEKIAQWGVLQDIKKVDDFDVDCYATAQELLNAYGNKKRILSIKDAVGYIGLRAGSKVMTTLVLGDINANQFLTVADIKHKFNEGIYTMDLTLEGGLFE